VREGGGNGKREGKGVEGRGREEKGRKGRKIRKGEGKTLWICSPPPEKFPSYATDDE